MSCKSPVRRMGAWWCRAPPAWSCPIRPNIARASATRSCWQRWRAAPAAAKLEQPADAFAHNLAPVYSAREIALPLLLLALLLLPLDIGVRRLMLRRGDFGAATAWMRTARFAPETPAPIVCASRSRVTNPARGAPAEQIERLRAAKARARRKARGEEETTDDRP